MNNSDISIAANSTPAEYIPAPGSVLMFTTTWCGYCKNLKNQMDRAGVTYSEVTFSARARMSYFSCGTMMSLIETVVPDCVA